MVMLHKTAELAIIRINMHASRLVASIDSLEARGLVKRENNEEDRRINSLRLTPPGREALAAIGQVARAHEEEMCAGLSAAERTQLARLLRKIAVRHELAPGIHPGYKTLGTSEPDSPCAPRLRGSQ
jgi:DNA-binding PadR family transcriptional regulator